MTLRRFGILLLLGAAVVPLALAGVLMTVRAEKTALDEVRRSNTRVAGRVASRLSAFVDEQAQLLATLGSAFAPSAALSPEQAENVVKAHRIRFAHLRSVDVVGLDGRELATARLDGKTRDRRADAAVEIVLAGGVYRGPIALTSDFAPVMTLGAPLMGAGGQIGAVVAEVDMVGIWALVNEIRVGSTGRARLVTADGTLIAHGDPEERRHVFLREKDPFATAVRAAGAPGARYHDGQGREVLAVAAEVPGVGWSVIIEQPVAEAFGAARLLRRDLLVVAAAAILVAVAVGFLGGRRPVRDLERMRRHAVTIAGGDLTARITPLPRLGELRALGAALNDMAAELVRLQDEARARERLNTFGRVAAGLAHDVRLPVQNLRAAVDQALGTGSLDLLRNVSKHEVRALHEYVEDLHRMAQGTDARPMVTEVDPRALADRVIAAAAAAPKWAGIEFEARGQAAPIWAEERLVARALRNLVGNAADACLNRPTRKVTLEVRDRDGGGAVGFAVVDTGKGLSADRRAQLQRYDFQSDKRSNGIGLGLGVARHASLIHGGAVEIDSVEGEGSTFTLWLPRRGAAGVPAEAGQGREATA